MKKTAGNIEKDFFNLLRASELKDFFAGIYYNGTRPFNSQKEDLVITFLTGRNKQIQTGVVILNAYVPDVDNGNKKYVKNKKRCDEIEFKLNSFIEANSLSDEYKIELDEIIKTLKEDGIDQHFVHCRIKFNRTTF